MLAQSAPRETLVVYRVIDPMMDATFSRNRSRTSPTDICAWSLFWMKNTRGCSKACLRIFVSWHQYWNVRWETKAVVRRAVTVGWSVSDPHTVLYTVRKADAPRSRAFMNGSARPLEKRQGKHLEAR